MTGSKKLPLISVITPSYNHEKYVQETIQSIIDQDYPNLEYIIIDDGS
jgi:alpha-1,3-rhamnosyltransferase